VRSSDRTRGDLVAVVGPKWGRRQARRQIPDLLAEGYSHEKRPGSIPQRRRMLLSRHGIMGIAKANGGEAADHSVFCPDLGSDRHTGPRPRGGSGILQALCEGRADPGAGRAGEPALRRGLAGDALVDRVFGSLRMVPRSLERRHRRRAGCACENFEGLQRPVMLSGVRSGRVAAPGVFFVRRPTLHGVVFAILCLTPPEHPDVPCWR
jgi:hypothetical protein